MQQSGIGDLGIAKVQPLKLTQPLKIHQPGVRNLGAVEMQDLELTQSLETCASPAPATWVLPSHNTWS